MVHLPCPELAQPCSAFSVGAENLNPVPHTCIASSHAISLTWIDSVPGVGKLAKTRRSSSRMLFEGVESREGGRRGGKLSGPEY